MPGRLSSDVGGLRREVKRCSGIPACLGGLASSEKFLTGCIERSVEGGQESKGTLGQNFRPSNPGVNFQASDHAVLFYFALAVE